MKNPEAMSGDSIQKNTWKYDPGENPKRKHGWGEDTAGFVRFNSGKNVVGKCPHSMDQETAERLINNGIPEEDPRNEDTHPNRIYVVHEGVLYRAVPTERGKSYHGFPERPKVFDELDDELKDRIWARARELEQEK